MSETTAYKMTTINDVAMNICIACAIRLYINMFCYFFVNIL